MKMMKEVVEGTHDQIYDPNDITWPYVVAEHNTKKEEFGKKWSKHPHVVVQKAAPVYSEPRLTKSLISTFVHIKREIQVQGKLYSSDRIPDTHCAPQI